MKIVIVGAGPAGCYTAQLMKSYGIKTRIIEKRREIGKPARCAGLKDVAYVIDREKFDKNLSKGLDVECGKKLMEIKKDGSGYILKTNVEDIYADLVIGADGPNSQVRKFMDLGRNKRKGEIVKYYTGVQYRIKLDKDSFSPRVVQVHLREGVSFFIWVIPEGNNIIRLGLIAKNSRKHLNQFIKDLKITGKIIERLAGMVSLGCTQSFYKNIALVGDAACQVKPLTGGGIYYGLKSAESLAKCIKDDELDEYDKRLKKKYGKEIRFGLKARQTYERLNNDKLKDIFLIFKKNAIFIEKIADFENHSIVFKEALKNPKIFIEVGKILRGNIWKILSKRNN
jgi:flavin-dependent dehydrogenase